ncbi:hypothetical protein [Flavobacterium cerinum]|uniref:Lipoprotein n=1 Tax=Flavobacterium cerinum TaxID=2502784 RepID=A0A3S3Q5E5_9FLAO|nr:hypothetical protein [Flavobacterium cerinum]RWW96703.1 hypothetical protein EPI11_14005 [Flavobacterium cerinum]
MKKIIIVFAGIITISCSKRDNDVKQKDVNQNEAINHYKQNALLKGDDFAYGTYLEYCDNNNLYLEKLPVSLIMNKKYNSKKSYYQIYRNIIELYNNNNYRADYLENLNDIDRRFAISYLEAGAKKNFRSCQMTLEKILRKGYGIKKNTAKSDSLYSILEKDSAIGRIYLENRNNKSKIDNIVF